MLRVLIDSNGSRREYAARETDLPGEIIAAAMNGLPIVVRAVGRDDIEYVLT